MFRARNTESPVQTVEKGQSTSATLLFPHPHPEPYLTAPTSVQAAKTSNPVAFHR